MPPVLSIVTSIIPGTRLGGMGVRYEPAALDFFTRLSSAGLELSGTRKSAYNRFFKDGRENGWLAHVTELYPFEGATLAQAAVKAVYRPAGTTSLTNNGVLVGDLLENGGYTSNAATKYWLTGINFNTIDPTTFGMAIFNGADIARAASPIFMGTTNAATPYINFALGGTADPALRPAISGLIGGTGGGGVNPTVNQAGPGFYHIYRASTTSNKLRINGVTAGTSATAVTNATRDVVLRVGAGHASGSISVLLASFDDGQMSDAESSAYASAVRTLMQALGRVAKSGSPLQYNIIIGQSLSIGSASGTPLSTAQSSGNRMHLNGVTVPTLQSAFCPLTEHTLETPASGFANSLVSLGGTSRAVSSWGVGGTAYSGLKKGTTPYNNSLACITSAVNAAGQTHTGLKVQGLVCVHGESDLPSTTYQTDIREWQVDYETDIRVITGQSEPIPIFHSQPSSFGTTSTARSVYAILAEHETNPTKSILVCPKYFLAHSDGIHLTAASYQTLGAYYAKAYYQHVVGGTQFEPLRPTSIVRVGAVITVSFAGRVGNLVLDTTNVSDPGNYGFVWSQTGGTAATISSVALVNGNTQVQITLSTDPGSPSAETLGYATPSTGSSTGNAGGPTTGPRGCLRDSDTTTSHSSTALPNWCVHFSKAVTAS